MTREEIRKGSGVLHGHKFVEVASINCQHHSSPIRGILEHALLVRIGIKLSNNFVVDTRSHLPLLRSADRALGVYIKVKLLELEIELFVSHLFQGLSNIVIHKLTNISNICREKHWIRRALLDGILQGCPIYSNLVGLNRKETK